MTNKKLVRFFSSLIILVFVMSFINAATIDNVLKDIEVIKDLPITIGDKQIDYKEIWETYEPIKIDNWLGLGETLWEGVITEHTEYCGIDCMSTMEIYLANDGSLIDGIIFETLQEDGSWIEQDVRSYQFKYWGEIDDYETQCVDLKQVCEEVNNETLCYIPQKCSQVKVGSHEGWINYNLGDEVLAGNYEVRLDATKKPSRTVDWIIETQGEVLTSWAVWESNPLAGFDFLIGSPNLTVSSGTITLGGDQEYDQVFIASGATVNVNSTIGFLNITARNVTIEGTISGAGRGNNSGGAGFVAHDSIGSGSNGIGSGFGSGGTGSDCLAPGGGGAGHVSSGGSGAGAGGAGGGTYGDNLEDTFFIGSGGGGGGACSTVDLDSNAGPGGRGGAAILINSGMLNVNGSISVNGASGGTAFKSGGQNAAGGGSGGSAGTLQLKGVILNLNDSTLTANGGSGSIGRCNLASSAGSGGGGSGGRIKIFSIELDNDSISTGVSGGAAGGTPELDGGCTSLGNGAAGGVGVLTYSSIGDLSTVTLNSPADNFISPNQEVEFNCSAEVTGGATLVNMSLWDNSSGSWGIRNTTSPIYAWNYGGSDATTTGGHSNTGNAFDQNDTTFSSWGAGPAWGIDTYNGKTFLSNRSVTSVRVNASISGGTVSMSLQKYDGSTWTTVTSVGDGTYAVNDVISGLRVFFNGDEDYWGGHSQRLYSLEYIDNESATTYTQIWNTTITDTTLWTCQACDSDGDCGFSYENRTVFLDQVAPNITLTSPNGTLDYNFIGGNETLNVTFTDNNLDICWYDYNGTNITIEGCVSGTNNLTNFTLELNNLNMTIYANDSVGNINSEFVTWAYQILELNQTFNTPVVELSTQEFSLLVTVTGSVTSANFIYNNTEYSANIFSLDWGLTNITSSFQIPSFTIDTNVTFYYNISMLSGSNIVTQSQIQEVTVLFIGNCTAYSNLLFNLSLFDEKVLTPIVGTIEVDVEILNAQGQEISTKSTDFFNITNASICTNINLTEATNLYNLELRYYVDPLNNSNFQYVPEFYHIQKAQTSNLPQEIDLYDLNINESTEFTIFYRDDNYISRPNVLLQIERKYVDEGIFRTVEIPITSSEGSTTGHFDLNNYKYKIIATENGEVLNTFDNPAIACESELSGICTLTLNGQGSPNPFEDIETINDVVHVISVNGTEIDVDYVVPSGETKEVGVLMIQTSPFQDPTTLCNQTISSSAGSFTCSASSTIGDSQIFIDVYSEGELISKSSVYYQEDLGDFFLLNNYAIASLFIILLVTMMVSSPMIMVFAATFSVAMLGFLFLLKGSSIGLVLGSLSWLIICGILILIKINKKDEQ